MPRVQLSITIEQDSPSIPRIFKGINSYTRDELRNNSGMSLYEICLKDDRKAICAGIAFQIVYGVLYIDQVWVDPKLGDVPKNVLLEHAHSFAKAMGCNMSTIHSMSFEGNQVFLQSQGYKLGAELKGYSHSHVKNSYSRPLDDIEPMSQERVKAVSHSKKIQKFLTEQHNSSYSQFPIVNFGVIVKDPHGVVLGGASIEIKFGSVYIDLLWLEKIIRKQGIGKQIMDLIHKFAKAQGANISTLCTMSFEDAVTFYQKIGYKVYYEKDGYACDSCIMYLVRSVDDIQPLEPGVSGVTTEVNIEESDADSATYESHG